MKNDRPLRVIPCLLVVWALSSAPHRADELVFRTPDTRLTGSVSAIGADGSVSLLTPHAAEPLQLAPGAVRRIVFSPSEPPPPLPAKEAPPSQLTHVRLANGDVLPVVVESLDSTRLVAISPDAGRLEIPRVQLRALLPGAAAAPVLYRGPTADGWQHASQAASKWEFKDKECSASGAAEASRILPELPPAFTLRFKLAWENQPNFQLHFADPLLPKGQPADRYLFRMTPAGIDLKRECSSGRRYRDVAVLNRLPSAFPDASLQVEIRADRSGQKLEILLNGESEGVFPDPAAPPPAGNGIVLVSNAASTDTVTVSRLEVLGPGNSQSPANPLPDRPDQDILTTTEDEQWRGILQSIHVGKDGPVLNFQPQPPGAIMEIPLSHVAWSALASHSPDAAADISPDASNKFGIRLRLHGGSELSAAECRFDGQSLTTTHPLLGGLSIPKIRLVAVDFQPPKTP